MALTALCVRVLMIILLSFHCPGLHHPLYPISHIMKSSGCQTSIQTSGFVTQGSDYSLTYASSYIFTQTQQKKRKGKCLAVKVSLKQTLTSCTTILRLVFLPTRVLQQLNNAIPNSS